MTPIEVLLIEDREDDQLLIARQLLRGGYDAHILRVETEETMRAALSARSWDVILCDFRLPRFSCQEALAVLKSTNLDIPFIALSGTVNEETILSLVRAGARDYVMKDNLARLPSAVEREIREAAARRQHRRLETQVQQSTRMEAIGRLAAGVAHDFNNLLTVITGFAQLALLDENPARAGLEQILLAAERAAGLTRQLLTFSRQQSLEPRVFDLNQLVRDMDAMLRRLIGDELEIVTRIDPEPLAVKADPGQMEQVILNLAVNARDALARGGKLILSTGRRNLDSGTAIAHGLTGGNYCVVSVSDNGSGIPADVLPHIFEPFFTTKPEGQGTGLGLATVYGIVQQSGGSIHAYSEAGTGTTMTVFLPSSAAAAETAIASQPELIARGDETILISEDDSRVLNLVSESLRARGFRVLESANGEEALAILHERGPAGIDVLITDVVMPGITGPLLAARASELLPDLKVLFMSGYTEDVIQHHGFSQGHSAFLQKPFAPRDLIRKIRQLLDVNQPDVNQPPPKDSPTLKPQDPDYPRPGEPHPARR